MLDIHRNFGSYVLVHRVVYWGVNHAWRSDASHLHSTISTPPSRVRQAASTCVYPSMGVDCKLGIWALSTPKFKKGN